MHAFKHNLWWCSAVCRFASEVVITGGAFAYATLMYGKFFGWMVGANTMLEYLLCASTVAKGFASYFTTMIGERLPQLFLPGVHCSVAACPSRTVIGFFFCRLQHTHVWCLQRCNT